jgi:hypothetical protein
VPRACKLGLEGIVSKRLGSPYRSGRSRHRVKSKNSAAPAVKREAEEDWSRLIRRIRRKQNEAEILNHFKGEIAFRCSDHSASRAADTTRIAPPFAAPSFAFVALTSAHVEFGAHRARPRQAASSAD